MVAFPFSTSPNLGHYPFTYTQLGIIAWQSCYLGPCTHGIGQEGLNLTGDTISSITINSVPLKRPYSGRLQESTKYFTPHQSIVLERQPYTGVYMQLLKMADIWETFWAICSHLPPHSGMHIHTAQCACVLHKPITLYTHAHMHKHCFSYCTYSAHTFVYTSSRHCKDVHAGLWSTLDTEVNMTCCDYRDSFGRYNVTNPVGLAPLRWLDVMHFNLPLTWWNQFLS